LFRSIQGSRISLGILRKSVSDYGLGTQERMQDKCAYSFLIIQERADYAQSACPVL
jgi:hypothetical protein